MRVRKKLRLWFAQHTFPKVVLFVGLTLLVVMLVGSHRNREFYSDGQTKTSCTTLFGMKVGRYYSYYPTGQKESQAWYLFGHAQGYQHYYAVSGEQKGEGYALMGKQRYHIQADPSGNQLHTIYDEEGKMGYMLRYTANGDVMDSVTYSHDAGIVYEQYFSESGTPIGRAALVDGEKMTWLNFQEDGGYEGRIFIDMERSTRWHQDSVFYEVHRIIRAYPDNHLRLALFLPEDPCPVFHKNVRGYLEFISVPRAFTEAEGAELSLVEYTPGGELVMQHRLSLGSAMASGPDAIAKQNVFLVDCFNATVAAAIP